MCWTCLLCKTIFMELLQVFLKDLNRKSLFWHGATNADSCNEKLSHVLSKITVYNTLTDRQTHFGYRRKTWRYRQEHENGKQLFNFWRLLLNKSKANTWLVKFRQEKDSNCTLCPFYEFPFRLRSVYKLARYPLSLFVMYAEVCLDNWVELTINKTAILE